MTEYEAGSDLDRQIAEFVMGWTLDPEGFYLDRAQGYQFTGWGDETRDAVIIDGRELFPACRAFQPSSDWGAMEAAIVRLNQLDPPWRVELVQLGQPPRIWRCTVFQIALSDGHEARAITAPLAVCRAALAALRTQDKTNPPA